MKRILSICLATLLLLGMLTGCGGKESPESNTSETTTTTTTTNKLYFPTPEEYVKEFQAVFDKATLTDIKHTATEYSFIPTTGLRVQCKLNSNGKITGLATYVIDQKIDDSKVLASDLAVLTEIAMILIRFNGNNTHTTINLCDQIANSFKNDSGIMTTGDFTFGNFTISCMVSPSIYTILLTCDANTPAEQPATSSSTANSTTATSTQASSTTASTAMDMQSASTTIAYTTQAAIDDNTDLCADEHDWVAQTKPVHHDEVGHYETVQDAVKVQKVQCPLCNTVCDSVSAYYIHFDSCAASSGSATQFLRNSYKTIDDWEYVNKKQWVVDQPAYDEDVVTGYHCAVCGTTK